MAYKGKFSPSNPEKYKGDPTNVIFRSLWERKVMVYLDQNPNVIEWSSEEIIIPYISPIDNKRHRYYPDFLIKVKRSDGSLKTILIEVKPKYQTTEPKVQKRKTRRYLTEVMTWGVNQSKWRYAKEYCIDRGWEFKILTEDEIFGTNKN
jgi:hypothetical protein